jgi:hypothetical protein
MPREVKLFGPEEGLRGLLQCDPGDIVSGGLGRWYCEDVPAPVADVPRVVQATVSAGPTATSQVTGADSGLALDPKVVGRMKLADLQALARERGLPVGKDATRKLLIAAILTPGVPGKPVTSEDVAERAALTAFLEEE